MNSAIKVVFIYVITCIYKTIFIEKEAMKQRETWGREMEGLEIGEEEGKECNIYLRIK